MEVIRTLHRVATRLVPRRLFLPLVEAGLAARHRLLAGRYRGDRFACPLCGGRFGRMRPAGYQADVLVRHRVSGAGRRADARCPRCDSLERERLLYLYLRERTDLFRSPHRVLHLAPERNLRRVLERAPGLRYVGADLSSPLADVRVDVTRLPFDDERFDAVLCSHVLEHVRDDRRALEEIRRTLRPGGWAILLVPVALALPETLEGGPDTPRARRERFGQRDHVRLYGLDFPERVRAAGFDVEVVDFAAELGPEAARFALAPGERLFRCVRPPGASVALQGRGR